MSRTISIKENGIYLVFEIAEDNDIRLLHFSPVPFNEDSIKENQKKWFRLAEIHVTGENQDDHHGSKHTGSMPGGCLKYKEHKDYRNEKGRKLEITTQDNELLVTSHLQFFDNVKVVRSWTEVKNFGNTPKGLEYVSSFALTGISKEGLQDWDEKSRIHIPHNTWCGEAQWKQYNLPEIGLYPVYDFSVKRISLSSTGTWPSSEYLPMGCYENIECGTSLLWQIEHNGSWHWEVSDKSNQLYLQLSGPTEQENNWWKKLCPGETFKSVPVSVAAVNGGFQTAIEEMTKYRRKIRRPNQDNEKLPVIFNDYMNCLDGNPTTDKLIPLIDAAADVGCEYFCIDAGWYSDGEWWDGVGEWLPSEQRFPGGIKEPLDYIRSKGMIPGLWLELEVMGIKCPLVSKVTDDCFFKRHGEPIIDHGRYQLDFRNPKVIRHANSVIDRLVNDYGVGYLKMDYNINSGVGTEVDADSFGDGLLQHNRAYLAWLDSIFIRYPSLVIENCGSGGMRMEYSLLSRHSIQSCTDQTDYRKMAAIAVACPTAVTPEQSAIWSYPLKGGDSEEVVFNMVNAMLMRIHQSGNLAEISSDRLSLIKEGIQCYKEIRGDINKGLPFWPIGLPSFSDEWISLGLDCGNKVYLAVWRLEGKKDDCILPINFLKNKEVVVNCIYPINNECAFKWNSMTGCLNVAFSSENSARIFEFILK
jgi:alpha-galactosidase